MATIDQFLQTIDVTGKDANDWVLAHVDQPDVIYDLAWDNGITTAMLSDLTNIPTNVIDDYFSQNGLDVVKLNKVGLLINSDLGPFANLVEFNDHNGVLSTEALGERVDSIFKSDGYPFRYEVFFNSIFDWYKNVDGIYSPDELGVSHLGDIEATNENIESIFYGTLINTYLALDSEELEEIANASLDNIQEVVYNALIDAPLIPFDEETMADLIVDHAVEVISDIFADTGYVGVLDPSFIGLATAEF